MSLKPSRQPGRVQRMWAPSWAKQGEIRTRCTDWLVHVLYSQRVHNRFKTETSRKKKDISAMTRQGRTVERTQRLEGRLELLPWNKGRSGDMYVFSSACPLSMSWPFDLDLEGGIEKEGKEEMVRKEERKKRESFVNGYERNPRGEEIVCFSFPLFVII